MEQIKVSLEDISYAICSMSNWKRLGWTDSITFDLNGPIDCTQSENHNFKMTFFNN